MQKNPQKCPKCGSNSTARILYGLYIPDEKLNKDEQDGKIVFGGCCISSDSPLWHCNKCSHEWGKLDKNSE